MAKPLCSRVTTAKTTAATAAVPAATVRTTAVAPVVLALAVVPRVLMARRPMAATSLQPPLTLAPVPSASARPRLPPRPKENKHVAT